MKIQIALSAEIATHLPPVQRVLATIASYMHLKDPRFKPLYLQRGMLPNKSLCHRTTAEKLVERSTSGHFDDLILIFGTESVPVHSILVDKDYNVLADTYPGNEGHFDKEHRVYVFADVSRESHPIVRGMTTLIFLAKWFERN